MSSKTLFMKKLKTENSMFMFIALFSFMHHVPRLKTTSNPWLTDLSMLRKHYNMLMKLKDSRHYLLFF